MKSKYLYVEINKCRDEMIWYNNYVGKIFCVIQSDTWSGSWQLSDENNTEYDFYIFKIDCSVVDLNKLNRDKVVLSNTIDIV